MTSVLLVDHIGLPILTEDGEYIIVEELPDPPRAAPPMPWTVDLCQGWRRIGMVEAFKFNAAQRLNEPGQWQLETSAAAVAWSWYLNDDGELVQYQARDVDTVRLVRPDSDIGFAGFVAPISSGSGGLEVSAENGEPETLSWSGPDLWDVLARRVAYPDPASSPTPIVYGSPGMGWDTAYDVRTGDAASVVAGYVTDNAGVTALANRVIPNLSVDADVVGLTATWSARLQPLSDLVGRICRDGGIVARLSVDYDGAITVRVTSPADMSAVFVFSDKQDLASKQVRRVSASVTHTIAGGQGAGAARVFAIAGDHSLTGLDRREQFYDQSSLAEESELQAAADVNTALGVTRWSVSAEVTEAVAAVVALGSAIDVGDWVTVEVGDERARVQITGAVFDVSAEKQVVRPVLGVAEPDALKGLVRDVAGLASRFDRDIK